jgi:hypothetical protein
MTTRPPGFGEGDPDAATNGIHGVNGHPDENVQPPWLPATRPTGQPPGAGAAGPDERVLYVPLGELDEPRHARPPSTGPSSAPASQGRPPAMRPTGQPPGAGTAGHNGRVDYVPLGELDERRRARPPSTGPWPAPVAQAPVAQGRPPAMRPTGQPPGAGTAGPDGRVRYAPLGEVDERRRARPPGTGPSSSPASPPVPPNARVSHKGPHKQPRSAQPLPPPLADAEGYNLRPNPLGAATVADLMECVRQYHIWAGNRGLRVMARHIEQQLSPQTLSNLLKSDQLPRLGDQMRLLIEACGGDAEDQQRFVTAWRRFKMG